MHIVVLYKTENISRYSSEIPTVNVAVAGERTSKVVEIA